VDILLDIRVNDDYVRCRSPDRMRDASSALSFRADLGNKRQPQRGSSGNGIPSRRDSAMKERQAISIYILERLGGTRRRRETAPASESDFILFGGRRRALKPEISFLPRGHVVNIPFYIMFPRCLAIAARWKAFPFMRDFILSLSLSLARSLARSACPVRVYDGDFSEKCSALCGEWT